MAHHLGQPGDRGLEIRTMIGNEGEMPLTVEQSLHMWMMLDLPSCFEQKASPTL